MIYNYSAKFNARVCQECLIHFSNVKVSLYRSREDESSTEPNIKRAFKELSAEDFKSMQSHLLAEGRTDECGDIEILMDSSKTKYQGESIEVIISFDKIPNSEKALEEVEHFRMAVYQPKWERRENGLFHFSELILPAAYWCTYLRKHGIWVICGQVTACDKPMTPIDSVTVKAYDVDWIEDDHLGSDLTDSDGWFIIYYDLSKFNRTPFSPFINTEWRGGPDVYFKIEGVDSDGNSVLLLEEPSSRGRDPDRENVSNCFCTKLCIEVEPEDSGELAKSAWTGVGTHFTIPDASTLNDFDTQGYAGTLKYAFTNVIRMTGQSLRFSNGNPIEYRFLVSNTTTDNGMAFLPEGSFTTVVGIGSGESLFSSTKIGQMWRFSPTFKIVNIYAKLIDLDSEGWLDVNKSIERTFTDDPSLNLAELSITGIWTWVDLDGMMAINTANYINHPNIPAVANAGDAVPMANRLPIQKNSIRFESREVIDKALNIYATLPGSGMTLNSMVVNNNPALIQLAMKEHTSLGACTPLSGDVHAVYTVSHPHLEDVTITARKNNDPSGTSLAQAPIPLNNNTLTSLDHINNSSGIKINDFLSMVTCTYIVKLSVRRRLHTGDSAVSSTYVDTSFYWET